MNKMIRLQFLRLELLGLLANCRHVLGPSHPFAQLPQAFCKSVRHYTSQKEAGPLDERAKGGEPTLVAIESSQSNFANTVSAKFGHIADPVQRRLAYSELRLGPMSASAAKLQRAFDAKTADPFETLNSHLNGKELPSVDIIRVCVIAAKNRTYKLRRAERAMVLSSKNYEIARQVLLRLMENHEMWIRVMLHDAEACSALCYFAVKEGIDPVIVDWIKMEDIDDDLLQILRKETNNRPGVFRNSLLKGLVEGHTMQGTRSADRALRCLKDINAWKNERREEWRRNGVDRQHKHEARLVLETSHHPKTLSILPATMVLHFQLCRTGWHETDPALYDWLIDISSKLENHLDEPWSHRGRLSGKLTRANLHLYHPVSPDATGFLELIQEICKPVNGEPRIGIPNPGVGKTLRAGFQRAYAVSKAHRRNEDATWLGPIYRNTFGKKLKVEDHWDQYMPPNWKPPISSTPQSGIADARSTVWRAIKP